jgi:RHS repeat-associated protein
MEVHVYDFLCRLCSQRVFSASSSTGKERGAESGNDYFRARYYSSVLGRFLLQASVKIITVSVLDLRGLNRLNYARNHPLAAIDRDG